MIDFTNAAEAKIPSEAAEAAETDAPESDVGEGQPSFQDMIENLITTATPAFAFLLSQWLEDRVRARAPKPPRASLPLRLALRASARVTRTGRAVRAFLVTYDGRLRAEECPLCVSEDASTFTVRDTLIRTHDSAPTQTAPAYAS